MGKGSSFYKKAIEERDNAKIDRGFCMVYEFNRIICSINLNREFSEEHRKILEEDFDWLWFLEEGKKMLMTTNWILAPRLHNWLIANKPEKVIEWLREHPSKHEDWCKSVPKELFEKAEEFVTKQNKRI